MSIRPGAALRVLLAGAAMLAAGPAFAASQITILHVNDTHSRLAAWGPKDASLDGTVGGLSKAATVIASEKARDPQALFVHAGDVFNGDLFFNEYLGVAELQLLQSLGLDALALGNHEFQFGPEFLAGVLAATWPAGGSVPIVGTNLDLAGYPILGAWVSPTAVKDVGGVKVGFFGLTTPYDTLEQPAPVVIRTDLVEVSSQAVRSLRAEGAQVVVCLAHVGMALSRQLAASVPGIDVIVNGHDHVAIAQTEEIVRPGEPAGMTLIVSAGEFYRWVGRLRLSVDGTDVRLLDYTLLDVDAGTPPLPPVAATVAWLEAGIVARYGDVYHSQLAWAEETLSRHADPRHSKRDTALGDLLTDAYRARGGTQIAIEAAGFIEDDLLAGPVVPVDLFRSMPYGLPVPDADTGRYVVQPFQLATFLISGAELIEGLEVGLASGDIFLQVSGMRFRYDSRLPPGQQVLLDTVHVGGHKLMLDELYSVTANEGAVLFMPMLGISVQDVEVLPDTAWGAVSDYVAALGVLEPDVSGRIRDVAASGH